MIMRDHLNTEFESRGLARDYKGRPPPNADEMHPKLAPYLLTSPELCLSCGWKPVLIPFFVHCILIHYPYYTARYGPFQCVPILMLFNSVVSVVRSVCSELTVLFAEDSSLIPFLSYALHSIRTTPPRIIASPATRKSTRRSNPHSIEMATRSYL